MTCEAQQVSMFSLEVDRRSEVEEAPKRRRRLPVLSQPSLMLDPELEEYAVKATALRPKVRGDCEDVVGDGPCPFVSCRYHLWSDSMDADDDADEDDHAAKLPRRMRWFEHLVETMEPETWGETCSLRVAERVIPRPSETGKWEGHSVDGEVIAVPGPVLSGDPGRRHWEPVPEEFASPRKVDAAVLGRFMGGLSREQIRKDLNSAAAKFRADPEIRELADAYDLDLDRWLDE
jgi:hypothetical protein